MASKIPEWMRFVMQLVIFNILPISYLRVAGTGIDALYVATIFLLINIAALMAFFKLKTVTVETSTAKIKIRR